MLVCLNDYIRNVSDDDVLVVEWRKCCVKSNIFSAQHKFNDRLSDRLGHI